MKIDYNENTYEIDDSTSWRDDSTGPIELKDNTVIFGSIFNSAIREDLTGCSFIKCTFNDGVTLPAGNIIL